MGIHNHLPESWKTFGRDHPYVVLLFVVALALLLTPFDEVLFLAAYAALGGLGILLVAVVLVAAFLLLRNRRAGQRWWGRAYGTFESKVLKRDS